MLSYGIFRGGRRDACRGSLTCGRPRRSGSPPSVRWSTFPDREVGSLLLERWPTLDAEARRESLAWFRPADRQALLLEAMEKERVSPADIGADLRRALLANKSLAERAEKLVGSVGAGDRRAVVQSYRHGARQKRKRRRRPGGLSEELRQLPPNRGRRARRRSEPGFDPHEVARRDPRSDPGPEPAGRAAVLSRTRFSRPTAESSTASSTRRARRALRSAAPKGRPRQCSGRTSKESFARASRSCPRGWRRRSI